MAIPRIPSRFGYVNRPDKRKIPWRIRFYMNLPDPMPAHDQCWEWQGPLGATGYGQIHIHGRTLKAHRAAFVVKYGWLPRKLYICHTCDNRRCCNPNHLYAGTHQDNMNDMRVRRRAGNTKR